MEAGFHNIDIDDKEALFLVMRYLKTHYPGSHGLELFEDELRDNGSLGSLPTWSGEHRRASMQDLERTHSHLPPDHIIGCFKQALRSNSDQSTTHPTDTTPSLLWQTFVLEPEQLLKLFSAYSHHISEKNALQLNHHNTTTALTKINEQLAAAATTTPQQQEQEEPLDDAATTDNATELRLAGLTRQQRELSNSLEQTQSQLQSVESSLAQILRVLRQASQLLLPFDSAKLTNTTALIMQREYFGSRHGRARIHHPVSRYPSACANPEFLLKYRKLFMVHGHIFNPAYCVIFDVSGRYVISGADDFLIKIWDIQTALQARVLKGHTSHISYLAISPDNAVLASAGTDCTIILWRIKDGFPLARLYHDAPVNWVKFDPVTGGLASVADDGTCKVWDVANLVQDHLQGLPLLEIAVNDATDYAQYEEAAVEDHDQQSSAPIIGWESTPEDVTLGAPAPPLAQPEGEAPMQMTAVPRSAEGANALPDSGGRHQRRRSTFNVPNIQPNHIADLTAPIDNMGPSLYPWTLTKGNALTLNHSLDNAQGQAQIPGRSFRVMCVDFCPLGSLFVTGSEDAVARVWRVPGYSALRKRPEGAHPNTRSTNSWSNTAQDTPDLLAEHLVCRLQGHVASVTDVRFSHVGDRIVTASQSDGTVRVWTFARGFSQLSHVVLQLNADNEAEDSQIFSGRHRATRKRKDIEVYNVAWSADDRWVFTLQSYPKPQDNSHQSSSSSHKTVDARLKVWDSFSGVLRHVIHASTARCVVLAPHPSNPSIVVTAGEDGLVCLWDVFAETCLLRYEMFHVGEARFGYVHGDAIAAVDGAFSSDGSHFVISDKFGRVTLFGLEDPEMYEGNLEQQLFSTDYNEVLIDVNGRAIDPATNLPTYLAPTGGLMDFAGNAYMPEPTRPNCPNPRDIQDVKSERLSLISEARDLDHSMQESYIYTSRAKARANTQPNARAHWSSAPRPTIRDLKSISRSTRRRDTTNHNAITVMEVSDSDDSLDAFSSGSDIDWRFHRGTSRRIYEDHGRRTRNSRRAAQEWADFNDSGGGYRRSSRRASRTGRIIHRDDDVDDSTALSATTNEVERVEPERPRRVSNRRTHNAASFSSVHLCEYGLEVKRDWLTSTERSTADYIPQLGDIVLYFPQGHLEHLTAFPESCAPPWQSFPCRWSVVTCKVTGIEYEFPSPAEFRQSPSIVTKVELEILRYPPALNESCLFLLDYLPSALQLMDIGHISFKVSCRKSMLPDFLVPRYLYERAGIYPWTEGSRFRSEFLEESATGGRTVKEYSGRIVSISDHFDEEWQHSPWEMFEVAWDQAAEGAAHDRISPWETKPAAGEQMQKRLDDITCPEIPTELRTALLSAAEDVVAQPLSTEFRAPVNLETFPIYYQQIAVPMDIGTIIERLNNNYYRQAEAYEFDVRLLLQNCRTFNLDESAIAKAALEITNALLKPIHPETEVQGLQQESSSSSALMLATDTDHTAQNNVVTQPQEANRSEEQIPIPDSSDNHSDRSGNTSDASASFHDDDDEEEDDDDGEDASSSESDSSASVHPRRKALARKAARKTKNRPARRKSQRHKVKRKSAEYAFSSEDDLDAFLDNEDDADDTAMSSKRTQKRTSTRISSQRAPDHTAEGSRNTRSSSTREQPKRISEGDDNQNELQPVIRTRSTDHNTTNATTPVTNSSSRSSSSAEVSQRTRSQKRTIGVVSEQEHDADIETDRSSRRRSVRSSQETSHSQDDSQQQHRRVRTRKSGAEDTNTMRAILQKLEEIDHSNLFAEPVTDDIAPHYFEIILNPMDRQTIEIKVDADIYQNVQEMIDDCELMFNNCLEYNSEDSAIAKEAKRQQRAFRTFIRSLHSTNQF